MRVRTLAQSLKKGVEGEHSDARCEIYGVRKNKQNNLRRNSHDFPDFIKSKQLLNDVISKWIKWVDFDDLLRLYLIQIKMLFCKADKKKSEDPLFKMHFFDRTYKNI